MKLKKIILLSIAAVIAFGCLAGAWFYFSQHETTNANWKYATSSSSRNFAAAENGCYFLKELQILHFHDYETGVTVPLCSKVPCEHKSYTCDARVEGLGWLPLFFGNQHIYYIEGYENGTLTRRNATGTDLTTIGIPGKEFVELQQSVSFGDYVNIGDYLYYTGSATNKENADTELEESLFVGRIHLSSGKDEILFQNPKDKTAELVQLIAAKDGSCLFSGSRAWTFPQQTHPIPRN